jgi:hypothetical protein
VRDSVDDPDFQILDGPFGIILHPWLPIHSHVTGSKSQLSEPCRDSAFNSIRTRCLLETKADYWPKDNFSPWPGAFPSFELPVTPEAYLEYATAGNRVSISASSGSNILETQPCSSYMLWKNCMVAVASRIGVIFFLLRRVEELNHFVSTTCIAAELVTCSVHLYPSFKRSNPAKRLSPLPKTTGEMAICNWSINPA